MNFVEGGYKGLNFVFEQVNYVTEFFRPVLLAYPAFGGGSEEVTKLAERCSQNNAENEPAFVVLGLAARLVPTLPTTTATYLVYTYTVCRTVHNIMFVLLARMPKTGPSIRSGAFIVSLMCMFALGAITIIAVW